MDAPLKQLVERMTTELKTWLDQPSDTSKKIARLREELSSLKSELGAEALADTLKKLDAADGEGRRARQREAAEAIALLCKPIGVMLAAKEPPKQTRKAARPKEKNASSSLPPPRK